MTGSLRSDWHGVTDVGRVRAVNEDSFAALPERGLWLVADGMGGHAGGDWASSRVAAGLVAGMVGGDEFDRAVARCAEAVHDANAAIWEEAQRRGAAMGTTIVALVVRGRRFAALWAGDSRIYLSRNGELLPLTRDHSQVQGLVDRGLLMPEDAVGHPMAHVLARAVGAEPTLQLDVVVDDMESEDVFLLTSDGVHGIVAAEEMAAIVATVPIARVPGDLIARAMALGSTDNLTAVAVRFVEPTQLIRADAVPDTAA